MRLRLRIQRRFHLEDIDLVVRVNQPHLQDILVRHRASVRHGEGVALDPADGPPYVDDLPAGVGAEELVCPFVAQPAPCEALNRGWVLVYVAAVDWAGGELVWAVPAEVLEDV